MRHFLRALLLLILGLLGFGFYKHDFNVNEYFYYLSNEAGNNISTKLVLTNPNTRHVILYDDQQEDLATAQLEAQLEKLNQLAESATNTGNSLDTPTSGQLAVFSGNTLPGSETTSENITQTWQTTTGEADGFSGFDFDEIESLFDFDSTGDNNTNTEENSPVDMTPEALAEAALKEKGEQHEDPKDTQNITEPRPEDTAETDEDQANDTDTILETETTNESEPELEDDGSGLSPLLQKRMKQYREYKKTLE